MSPDAIAEARRLAAAGDPAAQAFTAVLCKASGWMLDAPDGARSLAMVQFQSARKSIAVTTLFIWLLAGAAIAFAWFKKLAPPPSS